MCAAVIEDSFFCKLLPDRFLETEEPVLIDEGLKIVRGILKITSILCKNMYLGRFSTIEAFISELPSYVHTAVAIPYVKKFFDSKEEMGALLEKVRARKKTLRFSAGAVPSVVRGGLRRILGEDVFFSRDLQIVVLCQMGMFFNGFLLKFSSFFLKSKVESFFGQEVLPVAKKAQALFQRLVTTEALRKVSVYALDSRTESPRRDFVSGQISSQVGLEMFFATAALCEIPVVFLISKKEAASGTAICIPQVFMVRRAEKEARLEPISVSQMPKGIISVWCCVASCGFRPESIQRTDLKGWMSQQLQKKEFYGQDERALKERVFSFSFAGASFFSFLAEEAFRSIQDRLIETEFVDSCSLFHTYLSTFEEEKKFLQ